MGCVILGRVGEGLAREGQQQQVAAKGTRGPSLGPTYVTKNFSSFRKVILFQLSRWQGGIYVVFKYSHVENLCGDFSIFDRLSTKNKVNSGL